MAAPSVAQQVSNAQRAALLETSDAFLDSLASGSVADQRRYFSATLLDMAEQSDWARARADIARRSGGPMRYRTHNLIWIRRTNLLAVLEFSGKMPNDLGFVCGAMIWEFEDRVDPLLLRIEETAIEPAKYQDASPQNAVETLRAVHCPDQVISGVLGLSND